MPKVKTQFVCSQCGSVHPKWLGKCPDCGAWDSLQETRKEQADDRKAGVNAAIGAWTGRNGKAIGGRTGDLATAAEAVKLRDVDAAEVPRMPSGIAELDRVLGGGLVPGMAVLVGGEPGIGKSTLLLQSAAKWAREGKRVLYITSEESAAQVKLRAARLASDSDELLLLAETNLDRILHQIAKCKAEIVVVDSIQMVYKPEIAAAPGSVSQLRDSCMELTYLAKATGVPMLIVGHVTKDGTIAGPKIIEHIVDTVLYFEGDNHHAHRIVRCIKNRFGSTHEVGLFEMTGGGLKQVRDPGRLFADRFGTRTPPTGSVLMAAMTGSRTLLVEVQALTASSVVGAAKRKVQGLPADRASMIIAILEKRADLKLAADDVFVNAAGGAKLNEPATDLPVALAIASAHFNRPLPQGTLAVGELGLGGEVRPVPQLENRLMEAARLGVTHALVPPMGKSRPTLKGMALKEVNRLDQALQDL